MGNGSTKTNLSESALSNTNKYLQEDSIEDVRSIFLQLQANQNGNTSSSLPHSIDRTTFGSYFRFNKEATDQIFDEFDQDGNGRINSDEFLRGMALCSSGNLNSKVRFCYDAYDTSGDGKLQKKELEGLLLSTSLSSFTLLEAVGRSMDATAQNVKTMKGKSPDKPYERLQRKAEFKRNIEGMVNAAYRNSDKNDDNSLDYEEFFQWVVNSPSVMEVLYGTFQIRKESMPDESKTNNAAFGSNSNTSESKSNTSLFRLSPPSPDASNTVGAMGNINANKSSQVQTAKTAIPPTPTPTPTPTSTTPTPQAKNDNGSGSRLVNQQTDAARFRDSWRYWGNVTFTVSMFGLILMVVERLILHHVYYDAPNTVTYVFRYIVSVDCFVLVLCLIRWTQVNMKLQRVKGHVNPMATICSTPYVRQRLCFDIIIALIHVPPHAMEELQDYPGLQYWLTNLLSWAMLIRIYLLPSMLQQYFVQKYVTLQQEFLAKLSNVQFNVLFTLRAELRMQPFRLVFGALAVTVIITTFLLEEAELGLECMQILTNITNAESNSTNLTMVTVHSGGTGGAGDAKEWHWLYEGRCHPTPAIPGLGWFYYGINVALAVAPRRIPMAPAGESFNIVSGGVSLAIFAITVAAVQNTLTPTLSEQRVLQVMREEQIRVELRSAAIKLIQRSWRIYARAKMNARRAAKQKGIDFDESYGPHWDELGSKQFQRQLRASRKYISLSLWKWKQQKRDLHSSLAMLDGVSIDVSHTVNELMQLEGEYKRIRGKINQLDETLNVKIPLVMARLDTVQDLIRRARK